MSAVGAFKTKAKGKAKASASTVTEAPSVFRDADDADSQYLGSDDSDNAADDFDKKWDDFEIDPRLIP